MGEFKYEPGKHNFFPTSPEEIEYRVSKCLIDVPIFTGYAQNGKKMEIPTYGLEKLYDKSNCPQCKKRKEVWEEFKKREALDKTEGKRNGD